MPSSSVATTFHFDEAIPFVVPLNRRFRGVTQREGVLLRIGRNWGEWAPFPEYDDQVAARWLHAAFEAAAGDWPTPIRDSVGVNAIIPAVGPSEAAIMTRDAVLLDGCEFVKVKVGEPNQHFTDDVARKTAVRAALDECGAESARIRIDVNGLWTVDEAVDRIEILNDLADGLEYVEQPCRTLEEMAIVKSRVSVGLAVDEGLRLAGALDDELVTQIRDAADVLILKAIPLGGVRTCLAIAQRVALPITVSGSMDTSIGLAAALALATSLPDEPLACGMGTGRLLAKDLTEETLTPQHGRLSYMRLTPDPLSLADARVALAADRVTWWNDRLMRVRNYLEESVSS